MKPVTQTDLPFFVQIPSSQKKEADWSILGQRAGVYPQLNQHDDLMVREGGRHLCGWGSFAETTERVC